MHAWSGNGGSPALMTMRPRGEGLTATSAVSWSP